MLRLLVQLRRQILQRFPVPVSAQEEPPIRRRQGLEPARNHFPQFLCLQDPVHRILGGDAVLQFGQQQLHAVVALFRVVPAVAVDGQIPHHPPQPGPQKRRPLGGHGIPGLEIGIIDALLRILGKAQQIPGDGQTERAILGLGLAHRVLAARPVQSHDVPILHAAPSFF